MSNTNKSFVNPYNFVPLRNSIQRKPYIAFPKNAMSGYLECELSLVSPLFIPNTDEKKIKPISNKIKRYEFYSHDEHSGPIIPGSELRGSIRAVFEAAFDGCLSSIGQVEYLSHRDNNPKNPGILKYNSERKQWQLIPCFRCQIDTKEVKNYGEGKKVTAYVKKDFKTTRGERVKPKPFPGSIEVECYIHITNQITGKKYDSAFIEKGVDPVAFIRYDDIINYNPHNNDDSVPKDNRSITFASELDRFNMVVDQYNNKGKGIQYEKFDCKKTERVYPVYYRQIREVNSDKEHLYLTPACMGREIFINNINSMLSSQGHSEPCNDNKKVCPACSLFGMVGSSQIENNSIGSRIRFEDAHLISPIDCYDSPKYLTQLEAPKPSAVEFYTEPYTSRVSISDNKTPGRLGYPIWNYDYVIDNKRTTWIKDFVKLRGRKFYWHGKPIWKNYDGDAQLKKDVLIKNGVVIQPLKVDDKVKFSFRVHFENITEDELRQLSWAISLLDEKEELAHKLGYGKPLGLGSVKIKINRVMKCVFNINTCRKELQEYDVDKTILNEISKKVPVELRMILNVNPFKYAGESREISYPKTEKNGASYEWFMNNKIKNKHFEQVLPNIKEEVRVEKDNKWLKVNKK